MLDYKKLKKEYWEKNRKLELNKVARILVQAKLNQPTNKGKK